MGVVPLTPLIAGAAILLGVLAIVLLPREEEPQIVVPMIDVFVQMPGSTAEEVTQRVTRPLANDPDLKAGSA
jgi:multidrug efflux pump subunit AcrB